MFSGCESYLLKELFTLFVIVNAFFWPLKACALEKNKYVWMRNFPLLSPFARCSLIGLI